jgi:hypothetical protein
MRTTKNEFKLQVQQHIIERLDTDYTVELKEQLQNTVDGFFDWWGAYEQKRNPSKYGAFKDWLLGLPSQLNIEYRNYYIDETVKNWFTAVGETYKEPKDEEKTYALYYHLVTREFSALCQKNGVKF